VTEDIPGRVIVAKPGESNKDAERSGESSKLKGEEGEAGMRTILLLLTECCSLSPES
jgi:hypothetical protein